MTPLLSTYLDAEPFTQQADLAWIRDELAQGRLVIVRDAFNRDLAEAIHAELEASSGWTVHRDYGAHHQVSYEALRGAALTPGLRALEDAWRSPDTRTWTERLRGRASVGAAHVEAMWLYPGHYVSAYAGGGRSMSMYWDLTKDWDDEWGGSLIWLASGTVIRPSFNTLLLCPERGDRHAITPVNPTARGRRLAVTFLREAPDVTEARDGFLAASELAPIHIDDDIVALPGFREPEAT